MKRLTEFVDSFQMTIDLAYYPPYHSKYNAIERVWGVLEQHWNGSLPDSFEAALRFAQTLVFRGRRPTVQLVQRAYPTGVRLSQPEMARLEKRLQRLSGLDKWFIRISPLSG